MGENTNLVTASAYYIVLLAISPVGAYWATQDCVHRRVAGWKFYTGVIIKITVINLFWNTLFRQLYMDSQWYQNLSLTVNLLGFFGGLTLLKWCLDEELIKIVLYSSLVDLLGMGVEFTPILGISLLKGEWLLRDLNSWPSGWFYAAFGISCLLLSIIRKKGRPLFLRFCQGTLKNRILWAVYAAVYMGLGVINSFYQYVGNIKRVEVVFQVIGISAFMLVICCVILQQQWNRSLKKEVMYLQQQQNLMEEHYLSLEKHIDATRKFRHDIAKHMHTIRLMMAKMKQENSRFYGDMENYIGELRDNYEQLNHIDFCSNIIIDAVLHNKMEQCQRNAIQLDLNLDKFDIGNISETDMLSLLYNLLDNAIEASLRLEKDRAVSLSIGTVANRLIIRMENKTLPVVMEDGKLLTGKKDKQRHGIGLEIVKDILKKYDGYMEYRSQGDIFEITVNLYNWE